MLVSAQLDYALRALIALAQAPDRPVTRQDLARAQNLPARYLENVLLKLCHGGLLASVIDFIEKKIMPVVLRHAISGVAQINSEDPVLDDPLSRAMLALVRRLGRYGW